MKRIFLMIGTSNSQIEHDLKSTEDAVEHPNQTVIVTFLL